MNAFVAFLNDPQVALPLEYAVAAISLGMVSLAVIQTMVDRWRG